MQNFAYGNTDGSVPHSQTTNRLKILFTCAIQAIPFCIIAIDYVPCTVCCLAYKSHIINTDNVFFFFVFFICYFAFKLNQYLLIKHLNTVNCLEFIVYNII